MKISKSEYILRSLRKIQHKKWELFVITRIIHKLDDDIEFITQQLIKKGGKRYLTDLFFPQFNLHLEIDEPHHVNQKEADTIRQRDIIEATNHNIKRITIPEVDDIPQVRRKVDEFICEILDLKKAAVKNNTFIPWDWKNRYSSKPIIEKGYLSVEDNVVFQTQVEALRCFGFTGKSLQRGAWKIPDGSNDIVWFPRLYSYKMWKNELTNNGKTIYERAIDCQPKRQEAILSLKKQKKDNSKYPDRKYIVFAKAKDILGLNLLRYVGTFRVNLEDTDESYLKFDRISTDEDVRIIKKVE